MLPKPIAPKESALRRAACPIDETFVGYEVRFILTTGPFAEETSEIWQAIKQMP
jgi:hypothetical protein